MIQTFQRQHCCHTIWETTRFCIDMLAFHVPSKATNDASALYLIMLSYLGGKVIGGILRSLVDLPCSINIPLLKLGQSPQSLQYAVHVAAIPQVLQTNVSAAALVTIDLSLLGHQNYARTKTGPTLQKTHRLLWAANASSQAGTPPWVWGCFMCAGYNSAHTRVLTWA